MRAFTRPRIPESLEKVDRYLAHVVEMARALDAEHLFAGEQIILSAGGSKFFDRVAIQFGAARLSRPIKTVIRCGCYLFHDVGIYEEAMQGVYQARSDRSRASAGYVPRWRSGRRCSRARSRPARSSRWAVEKRLTTRGCRFPSFGAVHLLAPSLALAQRVSGRRSERSARLLGHAGGFTSRRRRSRGFRHFSPMHGLRQMADAVRRRSTTTWSQRSFEPTLHKARQ